MKFYNTELNEIQPVELEMIRNWRMSEPVSRFMYTSPKISKEQQESWYINVSTDPSKRYWLIRHGGVPVGVANVVEINQDHSRANWAFYIGNTDVRGRGIGASVEFLILDYVFLELGLHKLTGEVLGFNESVIKLHEQFGFKIEGVLKQHYRKDGLYLDVVQVAHFREDWLTMREITKANLLSKLGGDDLR